MSLFAAVLFAGFVFAACNIPSGFTERQKVTIYHISSNGSRSTYEAFVYQATNACDSYGICYAGEWYYVSNSNKDGYRYMFWSGSGTAYYFNM